MATSPIIITDLDNTLYNWVDYYCRVFRGMLHALSRETGENEDVLMADFRRIFVEYGAIEYPYVVQELKICQGKSSDYIEKLVRLSRGVAKRIRDANLRAYYGVRETLEWASREGIRVIGVTNAAYYDAEARLRHLRIDHLLTGLAAWEGLKPSTYYSWTPMYYPWMREQKTRQEAQISARRLKKRFYYSWRLPIRELKPNTQGYLKVLKDLHVSPEQAYVVGDSLHKDVGPANSIGIVSIWAKYGIDVNYKEFETLMGITTWGKDQIAVAYDYRNVEPMFTINAFPELRKIVSNYYQLRLELAVEQEPITQNELPHPNVQMRQLELELLSVNDENSTNHYGQDADSRVTQGQQCNGMSQLAFTETLIKSMT